MSNQIVLANSTTELQKTYPAATFNLLAPPTISITHGNNTLIVSVITIDPDDKLQVYPVLSQPGRFALHATVLRDLAWAAGLVFSQPSISYDPAGAPVVTLLAIRRLPGGAIVQASGTYRLDVPARMEELRLAAEAKTKPQDREYALEALPGQEARMRRFAVQLAETGAMNRALRALLNVKSSYTKDELRRPFAVARLDASGLHPEATGNEIADLYGDPDNGNTRNGQH
jgi:hypothetical protein